MTRQCGKCSKAWVSMFCGIVKPDGEFRDAFSKEAKSELCFESQISQIDKEERKWGPWETEARNEYLQIWGGTGKNNNPAESKLKWLGWKLICEEWLKLSLKMEAVSGPRRIFNMQSSEMCLLKS